MARASELSADDKRKIRKFSADSSTHNNPWAICTAAVGRGDPDKYERCVKHVKAEHGLHEGRHAFSDSVDSIPGGNYTAIENEDGTWTIQDVPIFSKLPKGARSNQADIGADWMKAAIVRHRQLEEDQQHLAPVHMNHHEQGRETPRVGFLRLTRVAPIAQNGKDVEALFADIVGVSSADLDRIQGLALPYRSVEVLRWEKPEIASLALLGDEAPFFKMPMLKIGQRVPRGEVDGVRQAVRVKDQEPVLAFHQEAGHELILFSFRGSSKTGTGTKETSMSKKKTAAAGANTDRADGKDKLDLQSGGNGRSQDQDAEGGQLADNPNDPHDTDSDGDSDGDGPIKKQIMKILASILPGMVKEALGIGGAGSAAAMADAETPVEQPTPTGVTMSDKTKTAADAGKANLADAGKDTTEHTDKLTERLAAMEGRLAASEARDRDRGEKEKVEGIVQAECKRIRDGGWFLHDSTIAKLRESAELSRAPEKAAKIFADNFMACSPKDPKRLEEVEAEYESESQEPEELQAFARLGPDVLSEARYWSGQYDTLKDGGLPLSATRKEYIEIGLERGRIERTAKAS